MDFCCKFTKPGRKFFTHSFIYCNKNTQQTCMHYYDAPVENKHLGMNNNNKNNKNTKRNFKRQNKLAMPIGKGKGSPYSIAERRVPELIPLLGSQPAGDVSHKAGGRLPLLSARLAVILATLKRSAANFAAR